MFLKSDSDYTCTYILAGCRQHQSETWNETHLVRSEFKMPKQLHTGHLKRYPYTVDSKVQKWSETKTRIEVLKAFSYQLFYIQSVQKIHQNILSFAIKMPTKASGLLLKSIFYDLLSGR